MVSIKVTFTTSVYSLLGCVWCLEFKFISITPWDIPSWWEGPNIQLQRARCKKTWMVEWVGKQLGWSVGHSLSQLAVSDRQMDGSLKINPTSTPYSWLLPLFLWAFTLNSVFYVSDSSHNPRILDNQARWMKICAFSSFQYHLLFIITMPFDYLSSDMFA